MIRTGLFVRMEAKPFVIPDNRNGLKNNGQQRQSHSQLREDVTEHDREGEMDAWQRDLMFHFFRLDDGRFDVVVMRPRIVMLLDLSASALVDTFLERDIPVIAV